MNRRISVTTCVCIMLGVLFFVGCAPASSEATLVPTLEAISSLVATSLPPTVTISPPTSTPTVPVYLGPSPRAELPLVYIANTNQVILFGGSTGDSHQMSSMNGETWIYDVSGNKWTNVKPPLAPSPRDDVGLAYDIESDRVILFGGSTSGQFGMQDTWSFDMSTKTWTKMKSIGPRFHAGHRMVYDSKADRILIFGGFNFTTYTAKNDIWEYDYNTDSWIELKPPVSPPGRNYQSMVYDTKADRVIMWGGWGTTNADNDKSVWIYDYNTNTWEERKTENGPSSRAFHNMVYDPKADKTILYGGYRGGVVGKDWYFSSNTSETWAYDYNLNTWTRLEPAINPGSLSMAGMVYLDSVDLILLFGGRFDWDNCSDKVWMFDFTLQTWKEIIPNP